MEMENHYMRIHPDSILNFDHLNVAFPQFFVQVDNTQWQEIRGQSFLLLFKKKLYNEYKRKFINPYKLHGMKGTKHFFGNLKLTWLFYFFICTICAKQQTILYYLITTVK